jgi:hypothetical protein
MQRCLLLQSATMLVRYKHVRYLSNWRRRRHVLISRTVRSL